jgi:hypothetical protein
MSLPNTPWLPAEHERFVKGLEMHGKYYQKISRSVITRTHD